MKLTDNGDSYKSLDKFESAVEIKDLYLTLPKA